jgi:Recombinase zinc beta ribbon domain
VAHQPQLARHRTDLTHAGGQGAPRQGAARLQGLLLCGRCGRRMTVRSQGQSGRRASSQCDRRRMDDGQGGMCWSVAARRIDAAVDTPALATLTPTHLDLALAVLPQMEADAPELDRHWQLQRERARYEAQRAARQVDAVAPENRLVARTLEPRWHEKRQQVEALERADAAARRTPRLEVSPQARQQILRLAADLPAVWQAPPTIQADRQELLRRLIKQIARTPVEGPPRQTHVQGLWPSEATTALVVPRPEKKARVRTPPAVVDASTALAAGRSDEAIAAALNTHGLRSGRGTPFTADAVAWIRFKSGIRTPGSAPRLATRPDARPDGRFATRALAIRLGVTIATLHYW